MWRGEGVDFNLANYTDVPGDNAASGDSAWNRVPVRQSGVQKLELLTFVIERPEDEARSLEVYNSRSGRGANGRD